MYVLSAHDFLIRFAIMKVLTWNCNLVFSKDFELIRHFDSDIIVIQECEKLDLGQFEGYKSHWIGLNDSKGLAVLTKGESTFPSDLVYFLPVSFGDTAVLGVWAFNRRANSSNIIQVSFVILENHKCVKKLSCYINFLAL
jgi:hypothetical protein